MDNDRRREALRVHFTVDGEADASEGGREAGGEPMIFYTITYKIGLIKRGSTISFILEGKSIILLIKHISTRGTEEIRYKTPKVPPSKNKKPNKRGALKVI